MDEMERTQFDEELENADKETVGAKPRPFLVWRVKDEDYKLKLTTSAIVTLETQFKESLTDAVLEDGIPKQNVLIALLQGAMLKYNHNIKSVDVARIIDAYIDEGHNYMDLLSEVVYPLMYDAGFFTKPMLEAMQNALSEVDTQL